MTEIAKPNFHAGAETIKALTAKCEEQAATIEQLRAALEKIRTSTADESVCIIAREALGKNDE